MQTQHRLCKVNSKPGESHGDVPEGGAKCTEMHRTVKEEPLLTKSMRMAFERGTPPTVAQEEAWNARIQIMTARLRKAAGRERSYPKPDSAEDE